MTLAGLRPALLAALVAVPTLALAWRRLARRRASSPVRAAVLASLLVLAGSVGLLADRVWRRLDPPLRVRGGGAHAPVPPPPGHVGLVAWGASTMMGDVFAPALHIPKVVAWSLGGQLGGQPLAVDNLAHAGTSLSLGPPAHLHAALDDPARFRPRVVLVMIGHNEAHNRGDLLAGSLANERRTLVATYRRELTAIVDKARGVGALVVLGLPAGNVWGAPPQRSRFDPARSPAVRAQVLAALAGAVVALDAPLPADAGPTGSAGSAGSMAPLTDALAAVRRARALAPEFARTHWLEARLLRTLAGPAKALDGPPLAAAALRRAQLRDRGSQRSPPDQNAVVRELCQREQVVCVDAAAVWQARCGALDNRLFYDLHHPRACGHLALGEAFARAIAAHVPGTQARPVPLAPPPAPLRPTDREPDRLIQAATWWLAQSEALRSERDDAAPRAFALGRVRASLAEAATRAAQARSGVTPDGQTTGDLRRVALLRAAEAAARADGAAVARYVAAAGGRSAVDTIDAHWVRALIGQGLAR